MRSLFISFIFTFNTLLFLAVSYPGNWGWPNTPPGFNPWNPYYKPPPGFTPWAPTWPKPPPGFTPWAPTWPKPPPSSNPWTPTWPKPPPSSNPWAPFNPWAPSPPYNKPPPGFNPRTPPLNPSPRTPPYNKPPPPPSRSISAKTFTQCMRTVPSSDFYTPDNIATFTAVLNSTAQNYRCLGPTYRKPILIFRPMNENEVPPAVKCARKYNLNMRMRSGGHDYEGLSFISLMKNQPFMILDLYNLRDFDIDYDPDTGNATAWLQAGGTNGEYYYKMSQVSKNLAFPAGLCSSLGIGGHLTGGAYGSMMREFGLGADNVLDVRMVDYRGLVLSRTYSFDPQNGQDHMDDNLFWALRGGGGASFGIILAWKVQLVNVPSKVTMFTAVKTLEQKGTAILNKWQYVAPKLDTRLFIRVIIQTIPTGPNTRTVLTIYQALYLGNKKTLAKIMKNQFPELGVTAAQCTEMSWIESVLAIAGFNTTITPPNYLLKHQPAFPLSYMKAKSDFLTEPMSIEAINGMMNIMLEKFSPSLIIWNPYGGMMGKIAEDATPFPHRAGVICKIQYVATWLDDKPETQLNMEDWMRRLYEYMTNYVSKNPRQAYVNYRDLDIGKDPRTGSNCSDPRIWGPKYFKGNFPRLVDVKTKVDPFNIFQHEQSIPTYMTMNQCTEVV
ncbi:hypothetical protein CASFOL_025336 [Castilleja foliolosa]|uniref:FAD-binding PCMH-type domain-containing protein n=1 Tax=Castilleja foliolosa TaxID=1961234 RepID=A0ABD3CRU9_9LAMI